MTLAETLTSKYRSLFIRNGINTPLRLAHFWAQCYHESGLVPRRENLNYSYDRLIQIFKRKFDLNKDKVLSEQELKKVKEIARNPQKAGNFIYANVNGNGNEASGDGWKYRGGGLIQITAKNNYAALSKATKVNFLQNPDLILEEANSLVAALWFWNVNNLNKYADRDDLDAVSDIINIGKLTALKGDANGFEDRRKHLTVYKTIFKDTDEHLNNIGENR